ncbi:MAG: heavy metal-associated domain-containing protein [Nanoarchaeota archaeon]
MKKIKMEIHGMHCASCAANIERSLSKVRGVKNPRVSLLLKKGTAEIDESVREEELKNAVKRTGYEVKRIEYE